MTTVMWLYYNVRPITRRGCKVSEIHRIDPLVEKYIKLRDLKGKIKAEYDEKVEKVDSALDTIEADLMTFLNQTGLETANSKFGTFFKKTTSSSRVVDRDAFLHFVIEHDALHFLESKANATAVNAYVEETGTVPPGVDLTRRVTISVNRPKSKTKLTKGETQ